MHGTVEGPCFVFFTTLIQHLVFFDAFPPHLAFFAALLPHLAFFVTLHRPHHLFFYCDWAYAIKGDSDFSANGIEPVLPRGLSACCQGIFCDISIPIRYCILRVHIVSIIRHLSVGGVWQFSDDGGQVYLHTRLKVAHWRKLEHQRRLVKSLNVKGFWRKLEHQRIMDKA